MLIFDDSVRKSGQTYDKDTIMQVEASLTKEQ